MKPSLRRNLKKLALYLSTKRESKRFSMTTYTSDKYGNELDPHEQATIPECKTVCCALGNGIRAGVPAGRCRTWSSYCDKFIETDEEFNWLFDYNWVYTDNTPKGAAYRIGYFLKNGIPDWFITASWVRENHRQYEECLEKGKQYISSLKRV